LCALGGADRRASDDAGVREHETVGRAGGASSGAPPGQGTGGGPPWEPVNQAQAGSGESLEKRRTQRFGGHLVARTRHRYWIGRSCLPVGADAFPGGFPAARWTRGPSARRSAEGTALPIESGSV